MFEEMNTIVLSGKEYPMKCDNLVLEKIQDKYEDLGKYENMLNGFVPELDEYGEEVRNEDGLLVGHYKMPDIKIINEAAVWFIQEGLAIKREENKEEIPEISDRRRGRRRARTDKLCVGGTYWDADWIYGKRGCTYVFR